MGRRAEKAIIPPIGCAGRDGGGTTRGLCLHFCDIYCAPRNFTHRMSWAEGHRARESPSDSAAANGVVRKLMAHAARPFHGW